MNENPLNETDWQAVAHLQTQLDSLRKQLKISERGKVLYRFDASFCEEEIVLVEADGFGGAVLRVVEGNYPTDFFTREEKVFQTESEAVKGAELFRQLVTA